MVGSGQEALIAPAGPKYKDYDFLNKVIINVCLAAAYSGYCLGYFNTINFDDTIRIFSIRADRALMQGSLSFCVPIGAGLGGFYARKVTDRFSRRESFLLVSLVGMLATLLLQTKLVPIIFVCRVVQGATVGASTVLRSTYIKQFAPLELAGKFGTLNQVFFAVGLISTFATTYVMSLLTAAEGYWRVIYIFPLFFLAVQSYNFVYTFPYETPKYLLEKERREDARQLISRIYKPEYIDERIQELEKHIAISSKRVDQEMMPFSVEKKAVESQPIKLTSNKIAVRLAIFQGSLQQLSGIQVVILYVGEIMLSIKPELQKVVPLILQIEGLVASLYAMRLTITHGRKQLTQFGLLAIGGINLVVAVCFLLEYANGEYHPTASLVENVVIVMGLFGVRWIFSMTIGPTTWLYMPQIVEPEVMGVATMVNWATAALMAFTYPLVVELTGSPALIFFLFAVFVLAGYAVNGKWMVETKGKPEWQVRQEYDEMLKQN